MFKCDRCKKTQPPRTKAVKVPLIIRNVTYFTPRKVVHGWERVKEQTLCPRCAVTQFPTPSVGRKEVIVT